MRLPSRQEVQKQSMAGHSPSLQCPCSIDELWLSLQSIISIIEHKLLTQIIKQNLS